MFRIAVAFVLFSSLLTGCTPDSEKPAGPPPEAMATTGTDQVVIYVPSMVCESCPEKVSEGLALLPWVDADSIQADRKLKQVRFRVKDRAAFDGEAVKETVARKGFKNVQILTPPKQS